MATINITPSTPVSLQIVSFSCNACVFNLVNGNVYLNITKTFADGSSLDEQIQLSQTDANTFLSSVATDGQNIICSRSTSSGCCNSIILWFYSITIGSIMTTIVIVLVVSSVIQTIFALVALLIIQKNSK